MSITEKRYERFLKRYPELSFLSFDEFRTRDKFGSLGETAYAIFKEFHLKIPRSLLCYAD